MKSRPTVSARRLPRVLALLAGLLFCLPAAAAPAAYRVEMEAPSYLTSLLTENLDLFRYRERDDINMDQLEFLVSQASDRVAGLAATEGYFSVSTQVDFDPEAEPPLVRLKVESGPRTMITGLEIQVTGADGAPVPQLERRLHRNWLLPQGDPFRQEDWDDAKDDALHKLQERRYASARLAHSQASIFPERHAAELALHYDTGPVFTFGTPVISGTQRYPESIIHNVNPLGVGEEYSAGRLLELQRALLRTPYYSNAVIAVEPDRAQAELAPVKIQVTEFPVQRLRTGVGYTTDTGARLEGRYSHFNVFDRAWVFDTQARYEQERQLASIELATPPQSHAFVDSVHGAYDRTTVEGADLRSRRFGIQRTRNTDKRDYAYTLEYYRDDLRQLSGEPLPQGTVVEPGQHQALMLGLALTRREVDNLIFPRRGYILNTQAGVAVQPILTDQTFFRLYGRLNYYVPLGRTNLLLLRSELGAVLTKGGNASIPASLLFRTGGTESVRGYNFQSIGNERDGTVFPTRYMATGSVEYQRWFTREWGGAAFYDVGTATDDLRELTLFSAVGLGVRYRTLAGAINFDLAYGFRDHRLRPHLSLGVAF